MCTYHVISYRRDRSLLKQGNAFKKADFASHRSFPDRWASRKAVMQWYRHIFFTPASEISQPRL